MKTKLNHPEEFTSMVRLIRRAAQVSRFALILANCSSFNDQKCYMEKLEGHCSNLDITLTTVNLWDSPPVDNLYSVIQEHLSESFPNTLPASLAIQVTGLEVSILLDADERFPAVLQTLNISRERYRAKLPYPLLIWLPDYALIKLANVAPDFWSVRDGSFIFTSEEQAQPVTEIRQMGLDKQEITEWQDKTAQIPLIERILECSIQLSEVTKTDLMLKLGEAYRFVGKKSQAKKNFEEALRLSQEQMDDLEREGAALNGLGLVYTDEGEFDAAIEYFEQYLALKQGKDEAQAIGYNHLGLAQYKNGEHIKAIESFTKALEINESLGKRKAQGDVLGNLGLVYRELGEFEQAITYHQKALAISREISQQQSEVKDLGNIGLVYHDRRDYEKAVNYYTQALKLSQQVGNRQDELDQYLNLGDASRDKGKFQSARQSYEAAHKIAEEIGLTRLNLITLEKLVDIYAPNIINDHDKFFSWTNRFIEESKISNNGDNQQHCLEKVLEICHQDDLFHSDRTTLLLEAEKLVKKALTPKSSVYLEKLIEIYQGLNQDDRVKLLQQELAQVRQARRLTIYLERGSVEVSDDKQPILQVRRLYTFQILMGESVLEFAWKFERNLPEETSPPQFWNKRREGFRISSESTETLEEKPAKSPELSFSDTSPDLPHPISSDLEVVKLVPPGNSPPISNKRTKVESAVFDQSSEFRKKNESNSLILLEFQGKNLELLPAQMTLPVQMNPLSDRVSLTVYSEMAGDHRLVVTLTVPKQKIRDKFEISLRLRKRPQGEEYLKYSELQKEIQFLRQCKKADDITPNRRFRLERQIKKAETEIQQIKQQLEELDNTSIVTSEELYRALLTLDYREQINVFRRVIQSNSAAAFLIHGFANYGQRWLLNRLVFHCVPKFLSSRVIKVNFRSRVRRQKNVNSLWREVARYVGLAGKQVSHSEITERVYQLYQTQNVFLILYGVEMIPETILYELIEEFWLPLVSMVQEQPSQFSKFKFLMFLIDYKGITGKGNLPFVEKLNVGQKPQMPIKLPRIYPFSKEELWNWIENEYERLPAVLTDRVEQSVQSIWEKSEHGIPELALAEICSCCGYNFYVESEKWLRL